MLKPKKIHYINNKKLQEEMLKYFQQCKEAKESNKQLPRANDYIGISIKHIATKYANKAKFFGYSNLWKEEMISDGIENCIKYGLNNYNPEKYSNPFAYFTEVIHFAFLRRIKREKKEQYKKLKSQQDNEHLVTLNSNKYKNNENEIADNMIKDFEHKMLDEKNKRNTKKGVELFLE